MHPFEDAMRQIQQVANISDKHTLLNKRMSALELTRVEGEITIATARANAADAEVSKLRLTLGLVSDDEAEAHHLRSLITASTAERDARLAEVEALKQYLKIKQEIAELALDLDPNAMNHMVALMSGTTGDTSEESDS